MDSAVENTVERIHSSTARMVLYLGGGAAQVPGRRSLPPLQSQTLLQAFNGCMRGWKGGGCHVDS